MTVQGDAVSDDFQVRLHRALAIANIPTLQLLTTQLTGDRSWISKPYLPARSKGIDDNDTGGLPERSQEEIRAAAFEAIMLWRAGRLPALSAPSASEMADMMGASEAGTIPAEYADVMCARLQAYTNPEDVVPVVHPPEGFRILIVGAGMSGVCAAIRFKQAGITYEIVEKQDDAGGVWHSHTYPACAVDTPGHLYSYTFSGGDWSRYFPLQDEIESYFTGVARDFGIYDEIRFRTEVLSAQYDERSHQWQVELRTAEGTVETHTVDVLVAAPGIFNEPVIPAIPGLGEFEGAVVHTAQWDNDLDLRGRRVIVLGTGASAMQVVPSIAPETDQLTIFQRTRQWAVPFPKFQLPVPEDIRFLMREVPLYQHWYRLRLSWIFDSKVYPSLQRDPGWDDGGRSINAINAGHRRYFERYIREELGDRQDLADRVIPHYPPYGKRMLLDNGWFRTLTRPNVELIDSVDDAPASFDATGVVTRSGRHIDADVVVLATGYRVANMLSTFEIVGRDGASIRDIWGSEEPRAYLGTVVPKFPNMFVLYGPNTQLGHGGAFVFVMECQIGYVIDALRQMFELGIDELECRVDVHDEYNDKIQRLHQKMIWTHPGMTTYVRNSSGRVVGNNPWRLVDFWALLRSANMEDFLVHDQTEVMA